MPSILTSRAFLLPKIIYNKNMPIEQEKQEQKNQINWNKEFYIPPIVDNLENHSFAREFNQCYQEDNLDQPLIDLCAKIVDYNENWKMKFGRLAEIHIVKAMKDLTLPDVYIESAPISLDMPPDSSKVDMIMVFGSPPFWLPIQFMATRSHLNKDGQDKFREKFLHCIIHGIKPIKRHRERYMFNGANLPIAFGNVEENTFLNDNSQKIAIEFLNSLVSSMDCSTRRLSLRAYKNNYQIGATEAQKLEAYRLELERLLQMIHTKHS